MRRALRRGGVVTLFLLAPAVALAAQEPGDPSASRGEAVASGYLPAEHWASQAAQRAKELGLVHGFLPSQRLVPLTAIEAALREAAGSEAPPRVRALAEAWYARFTEEFPGTAPNGPAVRLQGATAELGAISHVGRVAAGRRQFDNPTGSEPLDDLEGVVGSASLAASLGRHVAVQVSPYYDPDGLGVAVADLTMAAGAWSAAIGRQHVGYGWARRGGVVLSGATPFDRIELATRRPIRLPAPLTGIGSVGLHTFLSRLDEERHPGSPYFWGARGVLQPHPRLELAVQRASMFGGSGSDRPITARNILRMLVGTLRGGSFENQVVSVAGRLMLPTERLMPLTVYGEWGAEDGAGAWRDVPGGVFGIESPAVAGVPELSAGIELASLSSACCGNPPWYRHHAFAGSWANGDMPLGHALGGSGSEIMGHAGVDLLDARLRLEGRAFQRTRREDNLFVPGRAGSSTGFIGEAAWRPLPRIELHLRAAREEGGDWAETAVQASGRIFLPG